MLTREEDIEATALAARGWTISASAIARHLGRDRKTIRGYLKGVRAPGVRAKPVAAGPDPFEKYVEYHDVEGDNEDSGQGGGAFAADGRNLGSSAGADAQKSRSSPTTASGCSSGTNVRRVRGEGGAAIGHRGDRSGTLAGSSRCAARP